MPICQQNEARHLLCPASAATNDAFHVASPSTLDVHMYMQTHPLSLLEG